jgi:ankyrin repeat protein
MDDYMIDGKRKGAPPPAPPPGVDRLGFTKLYTAAFKGDLEKIAELLASGEDIEGRCTSGETALHGAVYNNKPQAIKALLAAGADIEVKAFITSHTPLHRAANIRSIKPMEVLLEAGANVNEIDTFGHTAMHMTAAKNAVKHLKLLLARGGTVLGFDRGVAPPPVIASHDG